MSDVSAHVTMCKRNSRPPLLSVVLFRTACLSLLLEARKPVTDVSQDRDFKLHNLTVTERNLLFAKASSSWV